MEIPDRLQATSGDLGTRALRPMFDLVLGCRLSFDSALEVDALRRAARLLLDAEPVLGCWFDEGFFGGRWVRCEDLHPAVAFSMQGSADPDCDCLDFYSRPLQAHGPRMQVCLLRTRAGDDLCLKVDHVAADGWSAKQLAYMLAGIYSRLLVEPDYVPEPELRPRPSGTDVWDSLTTEQKTAASATPPLSTSMWKMGLASSAQRGFTARALRLAPDEHQGLRVRAAELGATVNDAMVAALLRSLSRRFPTKQPVMSISADARRFATAPSLQRVCVLATPQTVAFPQPSGQEFEFDVKSVTEAIDPWKRSLWGIRYQRRPGLPHAVMRMMFATAAVAARRSGSSLPVVMNVGPMDEDRLRFGDKSPSDALVLGSTPLLPGFGPTVSSYRGALTVWMGCFQNVTSAGLLEDVLADMEGDLRTQ